MMQRSTMHKIFILVAMAPCLAAASLRAQQMSGMGGMGAGMPMPGDPPSPDAMNSNLIYGQNGAMGILLEQGFIRDLVVNGKTETGLSQLAVTNSSNAYVKSLAKVILADHQVMDAEVTAAASRLKVKLPQGPSGHLLKQEKKMQAMSGSQFDQAYLKELDHDLAEDGKRAKKGILSADSPDTRKLMAEVYTESQVRGKVIEEVGKEENLNLK